MPTVTTILMAAGTAYQAVNALNQQAKADKAAQQASDQAMRISNQQTNQLASLNVPTLGTKLAQENLQARQMGNIQALKESGAAGVLGGLTAVNQQAQAEDLQLAANADQMAYERDLMVKRQDQAIADAKINRAYDLELSRLQGAQTAKAANQSIVNQSIGSGVQFMGNMDIARIKEGQEPLKLYGEEGSNSIFKYKPVINT
jgi:hypothetical protein